MEYTDLPEYHRYFGFASRGARGEGWWVVDWPDADDHFSQGVQRLTRIATGDPRHMRFTDDHLFDYPWVYATQTGWWNLSDAETARLREYLLRGGFLVVDDFWGADQWENFRETMARVLPGHAIPDLAETDSVMHVLYDIQEKDRTFIPGNAAFAARARRYRARLSAGRQHARVARHVRRPGPHGGGGEFQHRRGRCLGIRGLADLSGGDDGAGVPIRDQLFDLFDDALAGCRKRAKNRLLTRLCENAGNRSLTVAAR